MLKAIKRLPCLGSRCFSHIDRRRFLLFPILGSRVINYRKASIKTFPQTVVNFLKKETEHLADTLTEETDFQTLPFLFKYKNIDPEIRKTLNEPMDIYNKLIKLLSFNPIDIPLQLYIDFIEDTGIIIDETLKSHVIRRLAFHGEFDYIWATFIDESSTINDIEEIVSILGNLLKECNNLKTGILAACVSAERVLPNQSLRSIIFDSFAFDFGILRIKLLEAIEGSDMLYSALPDIEENELRWLLYHRNHFSKSQENSQLKISMSPLSFPQQLPGWFSFIFGHISNHLDTRSIERTINSFKSLGLNDYDISKIVEMDLLPLKDVYHFFEEAYSVPDKMSSWALDNIMEIALDQSDSVLLGNIISEKHHLVGKKMLIKALKALYKENRSICLLSLESMLTSEKNYSRIYESLLDIIESSKESHIIFHRVMLATKDSPIFYLNLRKHLAILPDNRENTIALYKTYINDQPPPTKVLLELLRILMVRNRILDEDLIQPIVGTLLLKLTQVDSRMIRKVGENNKIKFHNSIRAVCQSISDLSEDEIVVVLNYLYRYINESSILEHSDKIFKDYLSKMLIHETLNFLQRKLSIKGLSTIVESLEMSNGLVIPVLFMCRVRDNPGIALDILKEFRTKKSQLNRKLMAAIERGILTSRVLSNQEKLQFFDKFRKELSVHGFKSKILRQNVILLIEIMLQISTSNESRQKLLDKVFSLAQKQKIPQHLLNKWIRKVMEK